MFSSDQIWKLLVSFVYRSPPTRTCLGHIQAAEGKKKYAAQKREVVGPERERGRQKGKAENRERPVQTISVPHILLSDSP